MRMDAILIHGLGRTPLALSVLGARLWKSNFRPLFFGYSVTFERMDGCSQRLERFIQRRVGGREYIIIGHSLGTVITRTTVPRLTHKPLACFLLTPPTQACKAARHFAPRRWVKLLGGEMAQLLADQQFMESIPALDVPAKIYAGTAGPRGRYSPFREEPNDSVLTVKETMLPNIPHETFPMLHTFIMNSKLITQDMVNIARSHAVVKS
jgi:hypothetical protein